MYLAWGIKMSMKDVVIFCFDTYCFCSNFDGKSLNWKYLYYKLICKKLNLILL